MRPVSDPHRLTAQRRRPSARSRRRRTYPARRTESLGNRADGCNRRLPPLARVIVPWEHRSSRRGSPQPRRGTTAVHRSEKAATVGVVRGRRGGRLALFEGGGGTGSSRSNARYHLRGIGPHLGTRLVGEAEPQTRACAPGTGWLRISLPLASASTRTRCHNECIQIQTICSEARRGRFQGYRDYGS